MIQIERLTATKPIRCVVDSSRGRVVVYGINVSGVLSQIVGAIGLQGISIISAHSFFWKQDTDLCFYDEFLIDMRSIYHETWGMELQQFIEKQGRLIFSGKISEANRYLIELIAEEFSSNNQEIIATPIFDIIISPVEHTSSYMKHGKDSMVIPMETMFDVNKMFQITVKGKDTPFLFYMLCQATHQLKLSVESFVVKTFRSHVEGHITVFSDAAKIDRASIRLNLLLYLKFVYYLQQAPNPYQAMIRFQQIIQNMLMSNDYKVLDLLSNQSTVSTEIAQLLGSGDYLWEDFVRSNSSEIINILSDIDTQHTTIPPSQYAAVLQKQIDAAHSFEDTVDILNNFKDTQSYLVDLSVMIHPEKDFLDLSYTLSELAKIVIRQGMVLIEKQLKETYGIPRSAAGAEAQWVLSGLGKFGGSAMGYASDIEIMLVYDDQGKTDGNVRISNAEYFTHMIHALCKIIRSHKEGIFQLDVRLRPYGDAGPLAVSLYNFIEYYRLGGEAHSVERLALTRLRPIAGSPKLAERILRLRDDFIYFSYSIIPQEIFSLRQKQFREKTKKGNRNAKFSLGALVDIEYNVQLLQAKYGTKYLDLRQPNMHNVLQSLYLIGDISKKEIRDLQEAYSFFRKLINALRMRRGNALDLTLPSEDSWELAHLARRMGYKSKTLNVREQLLLDFDTYAVKVLDFVQSHMGKEALASKDMSPAGIVLLKDIDENNALFRIFKDPKAMLTKIHAWTRGGMFRDVVARMLLLAWPQLERSGESDTLLLLFTRLTEPFSDNELGAFYDAMLMQSKRLSILFDIFSGSQFLSEEIIKNPKLIDYVCNAKVMQKEKSLQRYMSELRGTSFSLMDEGTYDNMIRDYKKREILRIITRDICLSAPLTHILSEISSLAKAILTCAFNRACTAVSYNGDHIAILAFGKFGAHELNYSSDLDLVCVYDEMCLLSEEEIMHIFQNTFAYLTRYTSSGRAYRIDLRLRPFGSGSTASSIKQFEEYYAHHAQLWEMQAMIKLRGVSGDMNTAERCLARLHIIVTARISKISFQDIAHNIHQMRTLSVQENVADIDARFEVKNSWGGLRDIEFTMQGLQLSSISKMLPKPDSLGALTQLSEAGMIDPTQAQQIAQDYCFLRRIEHFLQVYEDRQLHAIPDDNIAIKRRLVWLMLREQDVDIFIKALDNVKNRTSIWYKEVIANQCT